MGIVHLIATKPKEAAKDTKSASCQPWLCAHAGQALCCVPSTYDIILTPSSSSTSSIQISQQINPACRSRSAQIVPKAPAQSVKGLMYAPSKIWAKMSVRRDSYALHDSSQCKEMVFPSCKTGALQCGMLSRSLDPGAFFCLNDRCISNHWDTQLLCNTRNIHVINGSCQSCAASW